MKRFWKDVAVEREDGGCGIRLDGRPVKTPARAALVVPTEALANAIAEAGAAPQTSFVVGDTSFDMAMAASAGAAPIGAAWGYHDAEELIEAGAVAVAERPLQVLQLVRSHVHG